MALLHERTRKQISDEIGTNAQWFRRIITRELSRVTKDNRESLEALARLFRLCRVEDLWRKDLIVFEIEHSGIDPAADSQTQLVWRQKAWWPYAHKLAQLLASGEFEFLKDLIDTLHRSLPKNAFVEPAPGAMF